MDPIQKRTALRVSTAFYRTDQTERLSSIEGSPTKASQISPKKKSQLSPRRQMIMQLCEQIPLKKGPSKQVAPRAIQRKGSTQLSQKRDSTGQVTGQTQMATNFKQFRPLVQELVNEDNSTSMKVSFMGSYGSCTNLALNEAESPVRKMRPFQDNLVEVTQNKYLIKGPSSKPLAKQNQTKQGYMSKNNLSIGNRRSSTDSLTKLPKQYGSMTILP